MEGRRKGGLPVDGWTMDGMDKPWGMGCTDVVGQREGRFEKEEK